MSSDVGQVNLTPAFSILAIGAFVALIPLVAWLKTRSRGNFLMAQKSLAWVTLFLTFDLILFGAFTRLTDSGLGCPDWPGCYATASPIGAKQFIDHAQRILPSGPVSTQKAWIEMIHRYLATAVGGLIAVLCLRAWWWTWRTQQKTSGSPAKPAFASLAFFWVCVVGAFGALTVTLKLQPIIVTLHLFGALTLLCLLTVHVFQLQTGNDVNKPLPGSGALLGAWRHLTLLVFVVLWIQIGLGGWVSTNYAVLACHTFPDCNGSWWPDMDFAHGFSLWRNLGYTVDGQLLPFNALVAIHYMHRLFACLALFLLGLLSWRIFKSGDQRLGAAIAAISGLQLLTGMLNIILQWPLIGAVLHTGGAALLLALVCWQLCLNQTVQTPLKERQRVPF